jgi:hypothetical protein
LTCDFFKVTATNGEGTGESLVQFPIEAGDHVIADRDYGTARGIEYASTSKAYLLVRISPHNLEVREDSGQPLAWQERLREIDRSGQVGSWSVLIHGPRGHHILGRICVIRKTEEAIRAAHKSLRRRAIKSGHQLRPETLFYAEYVIVFTTFPESVFTPTQVMQWYRLRWQIELVFKRFKQIAQLGHLPKYDDDSSKAWLYGKLFVALMTEKLITHARSISPWGCVMAERIDAQPVA